MQYASHDAAQIITLNEALRIAWASKFLILFVTVLFTAAAVGLAFVSPRIYRSEALAMPVAADSGQSGALAGLVSQFGGLAGLSANSSLGSRSAAEYVALLQAPEFLGIFIREHDLLPLLFAGQWDATAKRWKQTGDEQPTLEDAIRKLSGRVLRVQRERTTGLVTVTVEWTDPQLAATWANDLIATANEQIRSQVIQEANASLDYLRSELDRTSVMEVRTAVYKLIEGQLNMVMMASGRKEYAFRVISSAAPSDVDHFVRPRTEIMATVGMLLGLMVGAMAALLIHAKGNRAAQ